MALPKNSATLGNPSVGGLKFHLSPTFAGGFYHFSADFFANFLIFGEFV
ncbi:MAG: hypothetical protein PHR96_03350 [Clostridia bacterium]|nr:hypothetical protein [Clostridia bacterium]